jgi:hypothetical protein
MATTEPEQEVEKVADARATMGTDLSSGILSRASGW